jgi:hypothetical protein
MKAGNRERGRREEKQGGADCSGPVARTHAGPHPEAGGDAVQEHHLLAVVVPACPPWRSVGDRDGWWLGFGVK